MIVGLMFTYLYIESYKGLFLRWIGSPWFENTTENWLFGISPEGIGVIGLLLNISITLIVSYSTKPPSESAIALVDKIRYPKNI